VLHLHQRTALWLMQPSLCCILFGDMMWVEKDWLMSADLVNCHKRRWYVALLQQDGRLCQGMMTLIHTLLPMASYGSLHDMCGSVL
jgi:hypothetical protein